MQRFADIAPQFKVMLSHSPWRLLSLYYGTVFLGLSALIFTARSSNMARYPTAYEFYNHTKEYLNTPHGYRTLLIALGKGSAYDMGRRDAYLGQRLVKLASNEATEYISPEDVVAMSAAMWSLEGERFPRSRWLCLILFDLAAFFIAAPAVATFAGVVRYTLEHSTGLLHLLG
ncbi:hypothetical protein [Rhizobium sp. S96]|uniref:hypothetical protein n=1 Tax=Rhizobium sp. S96 TaxID=3055140 RepID=UPI0025AB4003|nr:hypothetical protein [Rhizobium sp. S96]MDM9622638.1 hypothetical protein [Rhizobium sp. S96]